MCGWGFGFYCMWGIWVELSDFVEWEFIWGFLVCGFDVVGFWVFGVVCFMYVG